MNIRVEKSFARDVNKIRDRVLLRKLRNLISMIEDSESILDVPHIKKIQGFGSFYRIRIGDYRLGMEEASSKEVVLIRFLHRKDIYRYFPER
jgi:mRNA interferase RelE/StbE